MTLIVGNICTFFARVQDGISDCLGCPHCGGGTHVVDEAEFWKKIDGYEMGNYKFEDYAKPDVLPPAGWQPKQHSGYAQMFKWAQTENRCFKHVAHMKNSYRKHVGVDVDLTL